MRTPKPLEIVEVRPGVFMRLSPVEAAKFAKQPVTKQAVKPKNKKAAVASDKASVDEEETEA
jgi:hypothetical protein